MREGEQGANGLLKLVGLVQKRIVLGARNLDEALLRRNQGIEVLPREESGVIQSLLPTMAI